MTATIEHVAVIGAGTMNAAIATHVADLRKVVELGLTPRVKPGSRTAKRAWARSARGWCVVSFRQA